MCMFLHLYPARKHIQHFKVAFFRSMRYYSDLKSATFHSCSQMPFFSFKQNM